jgi:hypothetical protein
MGGIQVLVGKMKGYRNKNWFEFRKEIIELDGGACTVCKKTEADGVVLQVHHKQYIKGLGAWEYPPNLCETLCKGCHAAEHGIIPPKFGWSYIGQDDLGDLAGHCEYCGTDIRYVFYIHHDRWGTMEVGTICCDNLTDTDIASNWMESDRRFKSRMNTFIDSKRWVVDETGFHIKQNKIKVAIIQNDLKFKITMNGTTGKLEFHDILEAKKKVFHVIESGEAKAYLEKHR